MTEHDYADEMWREIPGYEGHYEASQYGRIRSVDRTVTRRRNDASIKGTILTPTMNERGNLQLRLSKDGKTSLQTVARLMLRTWHREPARGEVAAYLDHDHYNLHGDNLAWMSRVELHQHMLDKEALTSTPGR